MFYKDINVNLHKRLKDVDVSKVDAFTSIHEELIENNEIQEYIKEVYGEVSPDNDSYIDALSNLLDRKYKQGNITDYNNTELMVMLDSIKQVLSHHNEIGSSKRENDSVFNISFFIEKKTEQEENQYSFPNYIEPNMSVLERLSLYKTHVNKNIRESFREIEEPDNYHVVYNSGSFNKDVDFYYDYFKEDKEDLVNLLLAKYQSRGYKPSGTKHKFLNTSLNLFETLKDKYDFFSKLYKEKENTVLFVNNSNIDSILEQLNEYNQGGVLFKGWGCR